MPDSPKALEPVTPFAETFWGEGDRGLDTLLVRMKAGKHTCKNITTLYMARAEMEEEYAKKLQKLAKEPYAKEEDGTMKQCLEVVRSELEQASIYHQDMANEIRSKLAEKLKIFTSEQQEIRKAHYGIAEKSLKLKVSHTQLALKAKEKYEARCIEYNQLVSSKQAAQTRDIEKIEVKIKKADQARKISDVEYQSSITKLHEVHSKWKEDMITACEQFQVMEQSRLDGLRAFMWSYSNIVSTACVKDDESCERLRKSLEECNIEADMNLFSKTHGTGTDIPPPLNYVNFYQGPTQTAIHAPTSASTSPKERIDTQSNHVRQQSTPAVITPRTSGTLGNSWDNISSNQDAIPKGASKVRALYDYEAQGEEELSMSANDILLVIETHEDGWWMGEVVPKGGGAPKRGLFPSNFTEKVAG